MNRSRTRANKTSNGGALVNRRWLRRTHRWLGLAALLFVLFLSVSGIALNHSSAWQLDRRYLRWPWLLDAYGIDAPPPSASFAAGGHRFTLLGTRLYFDGQEAAHNVDALTGAVATGQLVAASTGEDLLLLTASGAVVEHMRIKDRLPQKITALGMLRKRVLVRSGDAVFRFDEALVEMEPWTGTPDSDIQWSTPSPVAADRLAAIQDLYRGRGVTLERLLADLHSGRLFTRFGIFLMDAVAVFLMVLSLTGLLMWLQSRHRSGS